MEIWKTIITRSEKEQNEKIESEVASRRFRVSAGTPAQVLAQVEADVYGVSKLGGMYENVLTLVPEDDKKEQNVWKLKLLHFYSKKLLGSKDKAEVCIIWVALMTLYLLSI